ncbi:MAG: hypothetical protein Q8M88_01600 [Phenylobacterium sp.]|uniref:hypothetical protein n=1 Tax=Phenylobacterium sp. TaxID=1871053 RepID=UPI002736D46D|nr:hypothetical protein [Phenylobacterium sp.]MDP3173113.1 hypothetical protein [Phenylobacterium sp.]
MKTAFAFILVLACTACASASPDGGVANYDSLSRAGQECAAKGGQLALQNGGDPQVLTDYACKRK